MTAHYIEDDLAGGGWVEDEVAAGTAEIEAFLANRAAFEDYCDYRGRWFPEGREA